MSELPFPGGERWFGWHRQTQSGSCWRSAGIVLIGDVEFSLGFSAELMEGAERGIAKIKLGQRVSQTHLTLNTTANGRGSRKKGLDEGYWNIQMALSCHPDDFAKICSRRPSFSKVLRSRLRVMDADFSHRNIFIQGHMPKLLFSGKIVHGADASKRRVESSGFVAFEQKEKN